MSSSKFRHEFTARFRLRSSSYDPTSRSRSQSTQRQNPQGHNKDTLILRVLGELCGEDII